MTVETANHVGGGGAEGGGGGISTKGFSLLVRGLAHYTHDL